MKFQNAKVLLYGFLQFAFLLTCEITRAEAVTKYPEHWWTPVDRATAPTWEILPQDAKPGEVVLSKRNELGILSNFSVTPFTFENQKYQSVEGFWQMMKFPDPELQGDSRNGIKGWPFTRQQVSQLSGFEAKKAGDLAGKIMEENQINWVSYRGQSMLYKESSKGLHYSLIFSAMRKKLEQNSEVRRILLQTGDLKLLADHQQKPNSPPEWHYNQIWMELRTLLH